MGVPIVMPQLGLTMEEGTVSQWLKQTGETVKKDEPLFSVATDKVEMDVESSVGGTLGEILVPAGETVRVGTVLAYVVGAGESVGASADAASVKINQAGLARASEPSVQPGASRSGGQNIPQATFERQRSASPRAKRLAKELGVDLANVRGSGANGQITEQDIRQATPRPKGEATGNGRRQLIAERLTRSIQTTPTFSVAVEVNAENLQALYEELKEPLTRTSGNKVTITDLLLTVYARVLKSSPEINAIWENNDVRSQTSVDIGLAVATEKGIVAPVIRKVDVLGLSTLVATRAQLVDKTRAGKLSLSDLEGGVGTLSNLGMYRVDHFQAIISPGQSSILAVGQIRKRPWVEDSLTIKPTVMLNLTLDHRVADGAAAAIFLGKIAELIENPKDLSRPSGTAPGDGAKRSSNA